MLLVVDVFVEVHKEKKTHNVLKDRKSVNAFNPLMKCM